MQMRVPGSALKIVLLATKLFFPIETSPCKSTSGLIKLELTATRRGDMRLVRMFSDWALTLIPTASVETSPANASRVWRRLSNLFTSHLVFLWNRKVEESWKLMNINTLSKVMYYLLYAKYLWFLKQPNTVNLQNKFKATSTIFLIGVLLRNLLSFLISV